MSQENPSARDADNSASSSELSLFTNAPIGITTVTPEGRFLSANPAMAGIFGYDSPDELIESVNDITTLLLADFSNREGLLPVLKENAEVLNYECKGIHRDGTRIWTSLNVSAERDENGKIIHLQGFITDITEQKRVEEALQHSENYYRTLFETTAIATIILEEDSTITAVNPLFEELSGYSRQEIEGKKSWTEFAHPDELTWMKGVDHYLRRQDAHTRT